MPKKIDVNPLLPFTYDYILYMITAEKKKASDAVATNVGGKMHRHGNAECTPISHSSVPPFDLGRERSVNLREQKAFELASRGRVVKRPNGWHVYSLESPEKDLVTMMPLSCDCPDFELRQKACKHILAVQITLTRELSGTTVKQDTETPPLSWPKKTYPQDWPNYDAAQQSEKKEFQGLLANLCSTISQPEPKGGAKGGRPAARLSDVIFASVFKVYCGLSGRRFAIDLGDAQERGFVSSTVHHSTIARCLEDPETTPLLISLIETSALPFRAIETEFAVDR